jgi:hypothetical protein
MGHLPIRTVEMPRLPQPPTRHRQDTQERSGGGWAEACPRGEGACRGEQAGERWLTIHGGGLPPLAVR